MNFLIEIIYKDDKKAQIVLPEEAVPLFLEKVKKNEYYSNDEGFGFINVSEIRYINVKKIDPLPEIPEAVVEEVVEETIDSDVYQRDEDHE